MTALDAGASRHRHLLVTAAGVSYCLRLEEIESVDLPGEVLPVPGTPPWCLGIWVRRGRFLPVADLGRVLAGLLPGSPATSGAAISPPTTKETRGASRFFVVARHEQFPVALVVDGAPGIVQLDQSGAPSDDVGTPLFWTTAHEGRVLHALNVPQLVTLMAPAQAEPRGAA